MVPRQEVERNMIGWINNRLRKHDEGFTLVELMVVVLVIAILIAIAIPTFLGARQRAQDRAAQSDLRNGLTAAKVHYVDNDDYAATIAQLTAIEPSLSFVAIAAADTDNVGFLTENVVAGDDQIITMAKESASGTFFCISDASTGAAAGTSYQSGAALTAVDTAAECNGASW